MKSIKNDFYGNSYIWWMGVVEDRVNDPLRMGCVRVRIFGIHPFNPDGTPDLSSVKTSSLPIAQVALPVTGAKSLSLPREGDWVTGFFQDGSNAQMPVITGVLQGVDNKITIVQVPNSPSLPEGVTGRVEGEPSNHRLSRGIVEGTIVDKSNNDRLSVCDITAETSQIVGALRTAFGPVVEAIRNVITSLISTLAGDPGGISRTIIGIAQGIKSTLNRVMRFVDDMKVVQELLLDITKRARSMVDYILSLPEKTLQFIRECAVGFLSSLAAGVDAVVGESGIGGGLSDLNTAAGDIAKSVTEVAGGVVDLASTPVKMLDVFLTPSTDTDISSAGETLSSFYESTDTNAGRLGP